MDQNELKWTKVDRMDCIYKIGQMWTKMIEVDLIGPE